MLLTRGHGLSLQPRCQPRACPDGPREGLWVLEVPGLRVPAVPGLQLHRRQPMGIRASAEQNRSLWKQITEPLVVYYLQPQHMPEMVFSFPKSYNRWSSSS